MTQPNNSKSLKKDVYQHPDYYLLVDLLSEETSGNDYRNYQSSIVSLEIRGIKK